MKDLWVKFGCFLTGYNYAIVRNSSEAAAKTVKRYTAALTIVCILWAFIGYSFTNRYLHGGLWGSIAGAILFVIAIIQIERQIILSMTPSKLLYLSRGLIASMMAIIGAIIIDQIIFKEDIELEKITSLENRVKSALPPKTEELRKQIIALDSTVNIKEAERMNLIDEIGKNPTIKSVNSQEIPSIVTRRVTDSTGRTVSTDLIKKTNSISIVNLPNPKQTLIAPLESNITDLRSQKSEKEAELLNVRHTLEEEIKSKVGFLDELEVMFNLITRSKVALCVWLLWFFLLFGIEMLVLIGKMNEKENDYEKTVRHHMELQMRKLEAFARAAV